MMVGAAGFEPATLWSQTRCATRLRYAPTYQVRGFTTPTRNFVQARNTFKVKKICLFNHHWEKKRDLSYHPALNQFALPFRRLIPEHEILVLQMK